MGGIAQIVPVVQAIGGIVSAVGGLGGGKEKDSAPPPPLPVEPTKEPEGAKDQEAARIRALKRRQAAQIQGGLLNLKSDDETSLLKKTLLGD